MAAEAGEDEFPGFRIPVEVDGHAGTRVEAVAEGDVQGEEAAHALIRGRVVRGVADLSALAEVGSEVAEAGLGGQEVVGFQLVGGVGLELREGDEPGEIAIHGAVVLEDAFWRLGERLGQDEDVLGEIGLRHMLDQNFVCRAMRLT